MMRKTYHLNQLGGEGFAGSKAACKIPIFPHLLKRCRKTDAQDARRNVLFTFRILRLTLSRLYPTLFPETKSVSLSLNGRPSPHSFERDPIVAGVNPDRVALGKLAPQ
jgi:hypothetical protein